MIAKQCKTIDYDQDLVKKFTPYALGSDEFTKLVRTETIQVARDSARLHRAYNMLFSQPSMDITKVGCKTTQHKNRNMKIDSDQATSAAPKLNNKEEPTKKKKSTAKKTAAKKKPTEKKSSATKHETASNQCQ